MKKAIVILVAVFGLIVIGTSSSWALYFLCDGTVYDTGNQPVPGAFVRGHGQGLTLTDYSNESGNYVLNHTSPPPTGWYDYCAYKQSKGMASTSIYHTWGTADSWYPHLDGTGGPCPAIPGDK